MRLFQNFSFGTASFDKENHAIAVDTDKFLIHRIYH